MAILLAVLQDSPNHELSITKKATREIAEHMIASGVNNPPCIVAIAQDDETKIRLLKSNEEVFDFVDDIIED
jgi:hypothetical protein